MRKYGVPTWLGRALIGKESGGSDTARSPKNALGRMQIHLPSHPDVSPAQARDPDFAMDYGFRLLAGHKKKFGNWKLALAAYNAGAGAVEKFGGIPPYRETVDYVKTIMGSRPRGGAAAARPMATGGSLSGASSVATPGPPSLDFKAAGLEGLRALASGSYSPTQALGTLAASRAPLDAGEDEPEPGAPTVPVGTPGSFTPPKAGGGDWQKWVRTPAPRQGPSAPHRPEILEFVGRVGKRAGVVLEPWGNESHSITTVNGNRSAHADGFAADIPATGAKLRRLGYAALLAAGMPKRDALVAARKGGLYNVGGYQVIFATDIGGNHHDHLHVGIRR
jgi:hypothetical protein